MGNNFEAMQELVSNFNAITNVMFSLAKEQIAKLEKELQVTYTKLQEKDDAENTPSTARPSPLIIGREELGTKCPQSICILTFEPNNAIKKFNSGEKVTIVRPKWPLEVWDEAQKRWLGVFKNGGDRHLFLERGPFELIIVHHDCSPTILHECLEFMKT